MKAFRFGLAVLCALMVLGAAGATHAQGTNIVTGTVTYLQRIALPPSAVITVRLLDISVADAPMNNVVAEQKITGGGVPAPFSIAYSPSAVTPSGSYALSAEIREGDKLLFVSNQLYSVINNGVTNVNMILQMVSAPVSGPPGMPPTGEAADLLPLALLAVVFAAALICSGVIVLRPLRRG